MGFSCVEQGQCLRVCWHPAVFAEQRISVILVQSEREPRVAETLGFSKQAHFHVCSPLQAPIFSSSLFPLALLRLENLDDL